MTGELTERPGPQNRSLPVIGLTKFQNRAVTVRRSSLAFPQRTVFYDYQGHYFTVRPLRQFRCRWFIRQRLSFRFNRPFPWHRFRRRAIGRSRLARRSRVAFLYLASVFSIDSASDFFKPGVIPDDQKHGTDGTTASQCD